MHNEDSVGPREWGRFWKFSKKDELVVDDVRRPVLSSFVSPDLTLKLRRLREQDTGTFFCIHKGKLYATYSLTVIDGFHGVLKRSHAAENSYSHVYGPDGTRTNYLASFKFLNSKWSRCSHCNLVGVKRSLKKCRVTYDHKVRTMNLTYPLNSIAAEEDIHGSVRLSSQI